MDPLRSSRTKVMGGTKSERSRSAPLESSQVDFRNAALQFPILPELSSGKVAMHKQVYFFLSSPPPRSMSGIAVAKLIFTLLLVPLPPGGGGDH